MEQRVFVIFFLSILALSSQNVWAGGQKYGVFVGIGKYKMDLLKTPTNDAVKVRDRLVSDFGFPLKNTSLILDDNAKRNFIISEINRFARLAQKGDIFVFYYSGHGTTFPDSESEELDEKQGEDDDALVPINSNDPSSKKVWNSLILDDEIFDLFSKFTNKEAGVIFISDSCFSGGQNKGVFDSKIGKGKAITPLAALGIKDWKDLRPIDSDKQRRVYRSFKANKGLYLTLTSSNKEETSFSGSSETDNLSVFTYYFLQTLDKFKAMKKVPTYREVFNKVKKDVSDFAKNSDKSQNPMLLTYFFLGRLNAPLFSFETFETYSF